MKKNFLRLLILSGIVLLNGCGYHIGYLGNPQLKTIAIAPVTNETLGYNVAAEMRGLLSEMFVIDGTMKVKSLQEADCVLYAKVLDYTTAKVTDTTDNDEVTYRVVEWRATVNVEFVVVIPGRKEPVINKRTVSGSALFQSQGDMENSRRNGVKMACRQAAQTIVQYVTEGW